MEVTDIQIRRFNEKGNMKALVSMVIDDAFVVHDVRIIQGNHGLFVAMPNKKVGDMGYRDIVHPINKEARQQIESVIFAKYFEDEARNNNL
ncbi:MAG: septation regulator SpoVG [Bacillota bacterium]|nr:septation regulator SpoVG [Bacillota bacterium]